ncbi:MAG: PIN domain-containing protein [Thermoflexibacteraceae bacterium]|jgi:tRNA(fMet)-specific endonuclease VapC
MSTDRFILDTNILVAAVRNSPIWQHIKHNFPITPENSYLSVVSEGEILSLAAQFKWGNDKLDKLQTVLATLNIIPFTSQLVKAYTAIDVYSQKLADISLST